MRDSNTQLRKVDILGMSPSIVTGIVKVCLNDIARLSNSKSACDRSHVAEARRVLRMTGHCGTGPALAQPTVAGRFVG